MIVGDIDMRRLHRAGHGDASSFGCDTGLAHISGKSRGKRGIIGAQHAADTAEAGRVGNGNTHIRATYINRDKRHAGPLLEDLADFVDDHGTF